MRYRGLNTGSAARVGFLIALACSAALPQHPVLKTRSKEDREERFNVTHRITMNVQVTDAAGNPVSDLRAEEFNLFDDRQARRIVAFHPIDGAALNDATDVVILLDAVNTPSQALDQARSAIFKYLAESRKPLAVPTAFALWFNGRLSITPASTDRNAIGRAFVKFTKNIHSNACGSEQPQAQQKIAANKERPVTTAANCPAIHFKDSVAALDGIAQQQLASGGRTLLIWMGSGWPSLSKADLERLDEKQRDAHNREFMELFHDLRAAQITMYAINPADVKPHDEDAASENTAAKSSADSTPPRIAITEFAERTGGRSIKASVDLVGDLHACVRDAEWYYSLAFNAPPAQNGPGEMHSLEVKVDRPGLQVRTINSYYSEPQ